MICVATGSLAYSFGDGMYKWVFGFDILRGRCACCRHPTTPRRPTTVDDHGDDDGVGDSDDARARYPTIRRLRRRGMHHVWVCWLTNRVMQMPRTHWATRCLISPGWDRQMSLQDCYPPFCFAILRGRCAWCRNPTSFYHAQRRIQLLQPGAPERGRGRKGGRCF